jgi:hypothetical protein
MILFFLLKPFGVTVKTNNYNVWTIIGLYNILKTTQTGKIICLETSMFSLYGLKVTNICILDCICTHVRWWLLISFTGAHIGTNLAAI